MGVGRFDRRAIEPLLGKHFPAMVGKTSEEWNAFLDAETGLQTAVDTPNPTAFDAWRKALSGKGLPVWGLSPERKAQIEERVAKMMLDERERRSKEAETLAALLQEAPSVKARDLLK